MQVITNRPIYSKPSVSDKTSNFDNEFDNFDNEFESFNDEFSYCGGCPDCSGTSNFDNEFSNCGGCSKFEGDYSNAEGDAKLFLNSCNSFCTISVSTEALSPE